MKLTSVKVFHSFFTALNVVVQRFLNRPSAKSPMSSPRTLDTDVEVNYSHVHLNIVISQKTTITKILIKLFCSSFCSSIFVVVKLIKQDLLKCCKYYAL